MYGYSNIGSHMFPNNPTINGIENASQNAFQSAQMFIGAFSSVSMMLESTLFAVQNSVRAIAGVFYCFRKFFSFFSFCLI